MELASEIDVLYGLPLDRFTPARNDLVRRLRADGRRDDAAEAAALRKPSLAAWTLNLLVRERRDDVDALLDAAATLRGGDHSADAAFRASVDRLVRTSRELVAASGRKASDALLQEVATTLRALAAAAPEELVAGRLVEAREASGFAGAGPAQSGRRTRTAPPARRAERERPAAVDREKVERARRALSEARAELRARERAASAAVREAERAATAAERARQAVTEAEAELREARSGAAAAPAQV